MKVKIRVKETVVYEQEIEINKDDYNKLKLRNEDDICCNENEYYTIENYINRNEIIDNTGIWIEFEINNKC